jgi:hypothetical protein
VYRLATPGARRRSSTAERFKKAFYFIDLR